MNRSLIVLVAGLVLATASFCGVYYAGRASHASLEHGAAPELAWLKEEFHLGNAEFARLSQMHDAYLSGCADRCLQIDKKNQALSQRLRDADRVTPEIEELLREAAQLRAECQKQMLQHFFEVSRAMPPEQGKRYLAWVQSRTVLPDTHATMHH